MLLAMEQLPFIDEHTIQVAADPADVWRALLRTLSPRRPPRLPAAVVRLWGLREPQAAGDWRSGVELGDTIVGLRVAECAPGRTLALRGSHRFSRYELRFDLEPRDDGTVSVHAKTSAEFPGALGRLYRACVIGSGGHRVVVRRMLSSVARRVITCL